MKTREGFVTNSSSTNFLIISKKELNVDYLFNKLGFKEESPLAEAGKQLCQDIIYGTQIGLRGFNFTECNYENVKEAFGINTAEKLKKLLKKGYKVYGGYTNSESEYLTSFFTMDTLEIDEPDFYLNGKNCVW